MKVSIFGLGYVGCVSAGCLSHNGHHIIGVDVDSIKVDLINQGKPTIIEKGMDELISRGYESQRIEASEDPVYAVMHSDISIICVGTPSSDTGHLNLQALYHAAHQIGEALMQKDSFHTIVIRSTVTPGTNAYVGQIIEEVSKKRANIDFGVVSNPEFLREGTAVYDFYHHPFILIGSESERALEYTVELYKDMDIPVIISDIGVCELIKYVCNSFHALKVVFANEIGNICKSLGIDSHKVMDIFCRDTKLNISPYYFKPGFAYGGSCLPKDLKGLCTVARDKYIEVPVLDAISKSNDYQKDIALKMIMSKGKRNIGILGLSFKAGTDDLRESPVVDIAEKLIGKGYQVRIYDKNVHQSNAKGINKKSIQESIPHLMELLSDNLFDVIAFSEVLVLTYKDEEINSVIFGSPDDTNILLDLGDKVFVDLIRIAGDAVSVGEYDGICW